MRAALSLRREWLNMTRLETDSEPAGARMRQIALVAGPALIGGEAPRAKRRVLVDAPKEKAGGPPDPASKAEFGCERREFDR